MPTMGQFRITPGFGMSDFQDNLAGTDARTSSERHIENVREHGGVFVEAVRLTRMPMLVTDATLPGNPIIFANRAFIELSGYTEDELLGQDPHFMNGEQTEPEAIGQYETASTKGATIRLRSTNIARTASRSGRCCSPVRWTTAKVVSPITSSRTSTSRDTT